MIQRRRFTYMTKLKLDKEVGGGVLRECWNCSSVLLFVCVPWNYVNTYVIAYVSAYVMTYVITRVITYIITYCITYVITYGTA